VACCCLVQDGAHNWFSLGKAKPVQASVGTTSSSGGLSACLAPGRGTRHRHAGVSV